MSTFVPYVEYDEQADAVYVYLSDREVTQTKALDDYRNIDLDDVGAVVGVEFLGVSGGIELTNVPKRAEVVALLRPLSLQVVA